MAGKYRRLYLSAGATLLSIFIALQLYGLQIKDLTGDVYCTDECVSYFDVINPTYRSIYIYNKQEIKLNFIPEIEDYKLYVKYYSKWVPMDFTMETRLKNVPKSRIYVFVFPRYSVKHFKLVGKKETWKNVKWSFGFEENELDPTWFAGVVIANKTVKELCNKVYHNWTQTLYHFKKECNSEDFKVNGTNCMVINIVDSITKTNISDVIDCIPTGQVKVDDKIISREKGWCERFGEKVCCVSDKEGGKNAAWYSFEIDNRLDPWCWDLITDEITFENKLKTSMGSASLES